MDNKLLLVKGITLLYRESIINDKTDSSVDLIRTVLENVQVGDVGMGITAERDIITGLKTTLLEMCNVSQEDGHSKIDLLQRLRINCGIDEKLYENLKQAINEDLTEAQLKRSIVSTRRSIENHFREQKITEILNKSASEFKYRREKIKDVTQFINELVSQLEPLTVNIGVKDDAVIADVDIGNEENLRKTFNDVMQLNQGSRVYKTGWTAVNEMLQGGFRPGECWVFGGLQHKYKTGFNLSLFAQIAMFNSPLTQDQDKKPLLLRISFEDDLVNNLQFLYQYLKYCDTREPVDVRDTSVDEMTSYVRTKLQARGFHIKMMRVDGSQWTYKSICNKIVELESQGYVVEVLALDYLYKVNRAGCGDGVAGNDIMDMFSRVRTFCASRGTVLITPHQLSTEAKQLLRGSVAEDQFAKEIQGKGYFEGTRGLDRVYDGALLIHLFKSQKKTYLAIQLDKHRLPTVIDDEYRHAYYQFPPKMPIPHDIDGERTDMRKLTGVVTNASDDLFTIG